jgi:ABC-2 type transport system permease protein
MNILGGWTLYLKEVRRFIKVLMQTIAAPMVTTLLFLAVFVLALHNTTEIVPGLDFIHFLAPGLIMMALAQNAFANTSSSLIIAKVNNTIVDVVMPPLGATEITAAFVLGSITRGILVALSVAVPMAFFIDISVKHWGLLIYYTLSGAALLGFLGILTGIWAEKFDQVATVTNFIVTPLSFLSGTFYSVRQLPEIWQHAAHLNPFFYMIDGARYAMTGYSDGNITAGIWALLLCNIALWFLCRNLFASGYKLQA